MNRFSRKNIQKICVIYIIFLLLSSIFAFILINTVNSSDTPWRSPSEEGDTYSDWYQSTKVYIADGEYVFDSGEQDYYGFNLNIPSEKTIDGIVVSVKGKKKMVVPDQGPLSLECSLTWNDFSDETTTKSETWENTVFFEYKEFGSSTDTWGRTWSYDEFSNSNFRVHFNVLNLGEIDHVRVKVYYSESNNPPDTTMDDIPSPAESSDVSTITGSATDTDGTISSVSLKIRNDTDSKIWSGSAWLSSGNYVYATADDGSFNEDYEDWTYDCESAGINWVDGKQYTINAISYDNDLEGDQDSATDTFVYSDPPDNNLPDTTMDDIPSPAESSDVLAFAGSATDADGTISSVKLLVKNNTGGTTWTGARWEYIGSYVYSSADDGSFDESYEEWTYDCESTGIYWVDGNQYTIKSIAYDNELEWDESPSVDTFIYSSGPDNSDPTAEYLSGADMIQFAGKQYNFKTRHQDLDGADEIEYAYAAIGSNQNDISFRCDPNMGFNPSVTVISGSEYVDSISASKSSVSNGWDITWYYTLDWDWDHDDSSDIDYYAYTTDDNGANSGWDQSNENADYENEIIFKTVNFNLNNSDFSEDGDIDLADGEWFRGGCKVKASGVICYEGTTTTYPPNNVCDVRLYANMLDTDIFDNSLENNGIFETGYYLTESTEAVDSDFDFEVKIENIIDGGSIGSEGVNGKIDSKRDNQAPTAPTDAECHPDDYITTSEYDDDTEIYFTWTNATDGTGSGIDTHYAEIGDTTPDEDAGNDEQDTDLGNSGTIYYYVRAKDKVGNYGLSSSDSITIQLSDPSCLIDYNQSKTTFKAGEKLRILANFITVGSDIDEESVEIEIETQGNSDLEKTSMTKIDNTNYYYDWIIPSGEDEDGSIIVKIFGSDLSGKEINPNPVTDDNKVIYNAEPISNELVLSFPSFVNEDENFEVFVTCDDDSLENVKITFNNNEYYSDENGHILLKAPIVEHDSFFEINAEKIEYVSANAEIEVKNIIEANSNELVLSFPSFVNEDENFEVFVTCDDDPVEDVRIVFVENDYYTNEDGYILLKAPIVEKNTIYEIRAEKTEYVSANAEIEVKNIIEIYSGYLVGSVKDIFDKPIKNALICLYPKDNNKNYRCDYSDEDGNFNISSETGFYTVIVTKRAYTPDSKEFQIIKDTETNIDFTLEKNLTNEFDAAGYQHDLLFDYVIEDASEQDSAGAKIDISKNEIIIFSPSFNASIQDTEIENGVRLKISAPSDTEGKVVFIKISHDTFEKIDDINNIKVRYDGKDIEKKNLDHILTSVQDPNSDPCYSIFSSLEKDDNNFYYIAVSNPSFSEHFIDIFTEVPKVFGGVEALFYNIFFVIIISICVISITIFRIKR